MSAGRETVPVHGMHSRSRLKSTDRVHYPPKLKSPGEAVCMQGTKLRSTVRDGQSQGLRLKGSW